MQRRAASGHDRPAVRLLLTVEAHAQLAANLKLENCEACHRYGGAVTANLSSNFKPVCEFPAQNCHRCTARFGLSSVVGARSHTRRHQHPLSHSHSQSCTQSARTNRAHNVSRVSSQPVAWQPSHASASKSAPTDMPARAGAAASAADAAAAAAASSSSAHALILACRFMGPD